MRVKSDPLTVDRLMQLEELVASDRNRETAGIGHDRMLNIVERNSSPDSDELQPRFVVDMAVDASREGEGRLELLLDALEIMGVRRMFRVVS